MQKALELAVVAAVSVFLAVAALRKPREILDYRLVLAIGVFTAGVGLLTSPYWIVILAWTVGRGLPLSLFYALMFLGPIVFAIVITLVLLRFSNWRSVP